jgi:hypothetical protein
MILTFVLAAAVLPLGDVSNGTCVSRAGLADMVPSGAGKTFAARHTAFSHDFGVTKWFAHETAGGEILWRKHGNQWCVVPVNGAYLDAPTLERFGVPAADVRVIRTDLAQYLEAVSVVRNREPSSRPDPDEKNEP